MCLTSALLINWSGVVQWWAFFCSVCFCVCMVMMGSFCLLVRLVLFRSRALMCLRAIGVCLKKLQKSS